MTVGTEQTRELDATGILAQSIVDFGKPPIRCVGDKGAQLSAEQPVDLGSHVDGRLPIHKAEQQQDAQDESAGDGERPAERGRACEIRQAHGG